MAFMKHIIVFPPPLAWGSASEWSAVWSASLLTLKILLDWSADCTTKFSVDCTPKSLSAQMP